MEVGVKMIVKGRVQGVGFRWFVQQRAKKFGLTGTVKNLYDGTVEIEAEGERGRVEELIRAVKVGPTFSKVVDIMIEWQEFTGKYSTFEVTF